ncbi:cache domain-containing sensor histidine kinase [Bacillus sp. B-jedd]|uniref:cache domain-containing sensor histidine kinase n=1 Tax=Bacillus sp. B-jedd TaxID=1476857 RepID=UPI0005156658|nr:histidine kinase [Bacillus sp. B-jedd]CEG25771.1 two-component sensor histidine kinase [Bacillus sp. B-jedd]
MDSARKVTSAYRKELKKSLIRFGVVPVSIVTLLFYNLLFMIGLHLVKENNLEENERITGRLLAKFSQISEESRRLANELDLYRLEYSSSYRAEMYGQLYGAANKQNLRSLFSVIDADGNVLATNWTETSDENQRNTAWYIGKRLKNSTSHKSLMYPNRQSLRNDRVFYNIVNPIFDRDEKISGYIIFNLLENQFRQLMNNVNYTDIIIADRFDNSILTTNEMLLTKTGKIAAVDKSLYVVNKKEMLNGTIAVYSISNIGLFKYIYKIGLFTLIAFFLLITAGTIVFANNSSRRKMRSIDKLLSIIDKAKMGEFHQQATFEKEDEFQVIGEYVQQLLKDIDTLMLENREYIERSSRAEIKQLEMQIDPHFLFNTLENIRYITRMDPAKAEQLILILSSLLRYSINNRNQYNTIEQDISYLRSYLTLQQIRFGDALDYTISVQDGLENCRLPKLIIQPLVENAIKYGFITKASLKIDVMIKSTRKALYLIIRDNGEGIEKSRLEELESSIKHGENNTNHIGIYNVNRRIKLLYGQQYGLRIFSEEGAGTLIIIRMPIIKED